MILYKNNSLMKMGYNFNIYAEIPVDELLDGLEKNQGYFRCACIDDKFQVVKYCLDMAAKHRENLLDILLEPSFVAKEIFNGTDITIIILLINYMAKLKPNFMIETLDNIIKLMDQEDYNIMRYSLFGEWKMSINMATFLIELFEDYMPEKIINIIRFGNYTLWKKSCIDGELIFVKFVVEKIIKNYPTDELMKLLYVDYLYVVKMTLFKNNLDIFNFFKEIYFKYLYQSDAYINNLFNNN